MSSLRTELTRLRLDVVEMAALMARPRPTMRRIMEAVAEEWCVSLPDLVSDRRAQRLVEPRQAAMALAWELTGHSLAMIGRMLRRDHTTIHHGIAAHGRRCADNPALKARTEALAARLMKETLDVQAEASR